MLSTAIHMEAAHGAEATEMGTSAAPPPHLARLAGLARSLFPDTPHTPPN
jgi:hypothetical protein